MHVLSFLLKLSSEGRCRSLDDSLDQWHGPRNLIECFPYLTVEERGIANVECIAGTQELVW